MLSRDQVLHVARLARLELTEDEVERLGPSSRRCSTTSRRSTSSATSTTSSRPATSSPSRTRCAPTSRGPSLPREAALESAPDAAAGRLPRPSPGARMSDDPRPDRGRRPPSASARATSTRGELWRAYRERALADELNAFTWVCERGRPPAIDPAAPLGGVPLGVKDLFCTEGVPSQAGSKILEGYRPPYTATAVERLDARRRAAAGQDQPGRVRDGLLDRELRLRPDAEPVGPHARARRLVRRLGRRRRRRHRARGRSAPTPAARSASPRRCAGSSASSRPTARSPATG